VLQIQISLVKNGDLPLLQALTDLSSPAGLMFGRRINANKSRKKTLQIQA
jgi:hypothetical protein